MRSTVRFSAFCALFFAAAVWGTDADTHAPDANRSSETADTQESNATVVKENEPVIIEDTSGLTQEELSKKAKQFDKEKKRLKIKDVVESIDENGTVDVTKLVKEKGFSPVPKDGYDWIRTKYGDWLVGHVRSLYEKELEFDSKEFGIYRFKFKDIVEIKTYAPMQVNIDNVAIFKGVIRYKDGKITIISGDHTYTFNKNMIISITSAEESEWRMWVGDFSLNLNFRKGNNEQEDIAFRGNLERRTPQRRFAMEYLGRFTRAAGITTANDNRLKVKYDIFYTKKIYFTPAIAEYYTNRFQNIDKQYTIGLGVGYTIFDDEIMTWEVAAGPGYLHTGYVQSDKEKPYDDSLSLEAYTKFDYKFNRHNKLKTSYQLTLTQKDSGRYKHHMEITLENDIIKDRIFIDTSFIWDYIQHPQSTGETTPFRSDYQLLVGGGLRF